MHSGVPVEGKKYLQTNTRLDLEVTHTQKASEVHV